MVVVDCDPEYPDSLALETAESLLGLRTSGLRLLANLLQELGSQVDTSAVDAITFKQVFMICQGRRILDLAEGCEVVMRQRGSCSTKILLRGMLEGLFVLWASALDDSHFFPLEKTLHDLKKTHKYTNDAKKLLEKAAKTDGRITKDLAAVLSADAANLEGFKDKYGHILGCRKPPTLNVEECAEKAGLQELYACEYAHYSRHTHADFKTILQSAGGEDRTGCLASITQVLLQAAVALATMLGPKRETECRNELLKFHAYKSHGAWELLRQAELRQPDLILERLAANPANRN